MAGCKSKKRLVPAVSAWLVLTTCTTLFFIFPCQYLQNTYSISITIVQAIISLFVITNFSYATFMDPGIIPKASPDEDVEDDFRAPLYKSVDINGITIRMKWCCTCQFYRPPRCSHCSVCNNCIETFDHHCPWVNNCIGRRNYRHFFFFLIFLSIHMITIFAWCILYLLDHKDSLKERDSIIAFVISGIILLLFIPIIGLTGFHIILVARGRTTNEQVTGKFQGGYNPFSKGCLANYCNILCGPVHTRYRPTKRKNRYTSNSNGYNSLHGTTRYDKSMQVYVDEGNKLLYSKPAPKDNNTTAMSPTEINAAAATSLNSNNELNSNSNNKKVTSNNSSTSYPKTSNNGYNRNEGTTIKMERLAGNDEGVISSNGNESMEAMESQSRDCEPSPPTSPRKASLPSLSSMTSSPLAKMSSNQAYKTNLGSNMLEDHQNHYYQHQPQCNRCPNCQPGMKNQPQQPQSHHQINHGHHQESNQQTICKPYMSSPHHCSQSHNLYHNHPVTMRKMDNGKTETTFPVTMNNTPVNSSTKYHLFHPSETTALTSTTSTASAAVVTTAQPMYNHSCVQCEVGVNASHPAKSPAKSSSVTEISSQNYSPCLRHHHPLNNSQAGGLVIYYSPEAGNYVKNLDPDYNPKFASESELQKLHQSPIIGSSSAQDETNGSFNTSTATNNSSSSNSSNQHFAKRPMSFMKALEMSNKLERAGTSRLPQGSTKSRSEDPRQSQYEMNYEISV